MREEVTQIDIKTPYAGRKAGEQESQEEAGKRVGSRRAELYGLRRLARWLGPFMLDHIKRCYYYPVVQLISLAGWRDPHFRPI